MACGTTTRPAFSFHFSQLSLPKPKTHFSRLPFISIYNPKKTLLTLHHSIDVSKEDIPQPPTASSTQESPPPSLPPPPPQSIQEDEIQSRFQGDEAQFDKRRLEEKFAVLNTGIYECRSCGFKYDEAVGDPSYPIPPGLVFDKLPEDWRCPTCGAAKSFFVSKSVEIAGFAQNQQFGLGANTLTSGQKALLIYGSLLFFFALFLSGYFLQ